MKGYTFVGNTTNCELIKEALDALAVTKPKLYAYITHAKSLAVARARYKYMHEGLCVKLSLDAVDINGKAIVPRGSMVAVYVRNTDMPEYNRRYAAAMNQGV